MKLVPLLLVISSFVAFTLSTIEPWSYECDVNKRCVKTALSSQVSAPLGLIECLMTCNDMALFWPKPREFTQGQQERTIVTAFPDNIFLSNKNDYEGLPVGSWIQDNFNEQVEWLRRKKPYSSLAEPSLNVVEVLIHFPANSELPLIRKNTDETYSLAINFDDVNVITANITAQTYFGARHGLESLFQAIEFDDVRRSFIMMVNFQVVDYPEFSHRGISLDTSRNFMTVNTLERILDGMAASKLNVFHWHIVDSHSFPVELLGDPVNKMTQYGAYDAESIYSQADIRQIVNYANRRGIRVIPEIDQPAHVGNGWNFPGAETFTVCTNKESWIDYCVEPPCGQLNPAEPAIYDILEKLYQEFYDMFNFDSFHMGADEIFFPCWNSSQEIRDYMIAQGWDLTDDGFISLWTEFQQLSFQRLRSVVGNNSDVIIWTNTLTSPEYLDNVSKDDFIIQIWTDAQDANDHQIETLAQRGYRMIFSNVNANYLDCGFGAWVGEGNNWCSPYKGWQLLYSNDPYKILESKGVEITQDVKDRVLGAEAAMWSEQTDRNTVEGKIFPRASAMAERTWSNPQNRWYDAEPRILHHRKTLADVRGIRADRLQPEWCRRNTGQCYGPDDVPENIKPYDSNTTTGSAIANRTHFDSFLIAIFSLTVLLQNLM